MAEIKIVGFPIEDRKNIKKFVKFAWKFYKDDPIWIPPLNADLLGNKLLGIKGLMTPDHPFHKHAEVYHWMAYRDGKPVGRIAACVNHAFNRYHKTKVGNFGFFECIEDYEIAKLLLDHAAQWLRDKGMEIMRGPGNYSNATHDIQGCLMDNFYDPPTIELVYNKFYYAYFFEKYGMKKAMDYIAIEMPIEHPYIYREEKQLEKIKKRLKVETRQINMENLEEEVHTIVRLYNECWKENWGFLPITDEEAQALADVLKIVAVPPLIRFALIGGKEVAVVGFLPDFNELLARKKSLLGNSDIVRILRMLLFKKRIKRYRFMFLGVLSKYRHLGLDSLLTMECRIYIRKMRPKPMRAEASLLLEDNYPVINLAVKRGFGHVYKRYRIYDYKL